MEKRNGVDGIVLLRIIWIGFGFSNSEITIGGETSRRRRRRDTPGKLPNALLLRMKNLFLSSTKSLRCFSLKMYFFF